MTTTNYSDGKNYELVICFNTLVYLNEMERALAGIGIQKALGKDGIFITNNGLQRKNNSNQELLSNAYFPLVQKKKYRDFPAASINDLQAKDQGSRLWVYKKASD